MPHIRVQKDSIRREMEETIIWENKLGASSFRLDLTSGDSRNVEGIDTITIGPLYIYCLRYGANGNVIARLLKSEVERIIRVHIEQVWP